MPNVSSRPRSGMSAETYRSVISDLSSLISHVQAVTQHIELAIAGEHHGDSETPDNVVILDDVTPCYLQADAALQVCSAELGAAIRILLNGDDSLQRGVAFETDKTRHTPRIRRLSVAK